MTEENDESGLIGPDQLNDLFEDTLGKATSLLDQLTVYRAGKEDYFKRGDDKVDEVFGVLLFSQRPMRTFWKSSEISDSPPDCWSLDSVRPHADSPDVQADKCEGCPNDKFGTAHIGRGKACKTRACDFVLEVTVNEPSIGRITKDTMPVVTVTKEMVVGPALVRYSIGNRDSANHFAALVRTARERGTPVQGLLCKWSFDKARSKSNVEFDVVKIEPLAKIDPAAVLGLVAPMVMKLKDGQARSILEALAGRQEPEAGDDGKAPDVRAAFR